MSNIEAFNIAVAEIFGQCYQAFPLKVRISNMDIGIAIKEAFGEDPDGVFTLSEVEYQIAEETMYWLIEAGYIWCKNSERPISFEGVTLSPKGLEILNAVPSELKSKKSLGEQLSNGIKVLGKDSASSMIKIGLTYGAKLAIGT
ncbi:hypothetical protein CXF80_11735 [Shewanella sp. Actino-trap-3]|jgi:hypothetical protein|uniref:hypothetical protein n=1 Tax=Shewanella sp. Actino-trap-3 TaxID=2058331 RepID=UPI000C34300E|nr:hypothetical protein [Shewanella sp. Actino-trap-3]PKG78922.1 hypothetical protein CXF80_11735 [Shewanella sp. Actino-trap-3]